jgi:predicted nucleic acid-binding protein
VSVLVDTSVWSLSLRRSTELSDKAKELIALINRNEAILIGPIRQEILSGIASQRQFKKIRSILRSFPDLRITSRHYELGASYYNQCRSRGIQGSHIDFLICSVANYYNLPIFTTDKDFNLFARVIPIDLYTIEGN